MSGVRKFKVKSRLSTLALGSGGITAREALKRADAAIESVRGDCLVMIDERIAEIERRFASTVPGRASDRFEDLYDLSSGIIDVALGLPESGIDHAARALCDLVDLSLERGVRDWEAVDVHIVTLRLLRGSGQAFSQAQRDAVLGGLKKVMLKRVGDPTTGLA